MTGKFNIKVTTVGTDSDRNMVSAVRKLTCDHMPCIAHMLWRTITVFLGDALAKCRKIVGHFKHCPAIWRNYTSSKQNLDKRESN